MRRLGLGRRPGIPIARTSFGFLRNDEEEAALLDRSNRYKIEAVVPLGRAVATGDRRAERVGVVRGEHGVDEPSDVENERCRLGGAARVQ